MGGKLNDLKEFEHCKFMKKLANDLFKNRGSPYNLQTPKQRKTAYLIGKIEINFTLNTLFNNLNYHILVLTPLKKISKPNPSHIHRKPDSKQPMK
jgi:hypothetical protein